MKKMMKGSLVVPQDERWVELQEPLQSLGSESASSAFGSFKFRRGTSSHSRRGERLASSRVTRDNLMHQMEAVVLQEAELGSALELLDYTRQRCSHQHDDIVQQLGRCEKMLRSLESGSAAGRPFSVESLLSQEERDRWQRTKDMVTTILPEVLARLEDNIELNNAKIRDVRDEMEELRARRLALREEIAVKEEDIAVMLGDKSIY
jgi:chaperonin cofactor prefoldin